MQRLAVVIDGHVILVSVDLEGTQRDTVAVAPDHRTEVGAGIGQVAIERTVAQSHLTHLAVAVGGLDGDHAGPVGHDLRLNGVALQCVNIHCRTVLRCSKRSFRYCSMYGECGCHGEQNNPCEIEYASHRQYSLIFLSVAC